MKIRYMQVAVIAAGIVLIAAAIITAKSDPNDQQKNVALAQVTPNAQAPVPGKTEAGAAGFSDENASKAVLDVQGMSCSGCIYTIKSSLADIEGINEVS